MIRTYFALILTYLMVVSAVYGPTEAFNWGLAQTQKLKFGLKKNQRLNPVQNHYLSRIRNLPRSSRHPSSLSDQKTMIHHHNKKISQN